ncbi:MAG: hypothetical protein GYA50_03875 [Eubacteriaceae bacterium]|nr:hypothetical protein [Eubacteriaceae bacterium]
MLTKINDIRSALKHDSYLSALALALTLPDICSQVEANTNVGNRTLYVNWVNKYLHVFRVACEEYEEAEFTGEVCYSLRCRFLHNGTFNVSDKKRNINVDYFKLKMPSFIKNSYCFNYIKDRNADGTNTFTAIIDIKYLCEALCDTAENFYNSFPDKSKFEDHICIVEKINKMFFI